MNLKPLESKQKTGYQSISGTQRTEGSREKYQKISHKVKVGMAKTKQRA